MDAAVLERLAMLLDMLWELSGKPVDPLRALISDAVDELLEGLRQPHVHA